MDMKKFILGFIVGIVVVETLFGIYKAHQSQPIEIKEARHNYKAICVTPMGPVVSEQIPNVEEVGLEGDRVSITTQAGTLIIHLSSCLLIDK